MQLTLIQDLPEWEIALTNSEVIRVYAHSYRQEAGVLRFFALVEDTPVREIPIATFPADIVKSILGG